MAAKLRECYSAFVSRCYAGLDDIEVESRPQALATQLLAGGQVGHAFVGGVSLLVHLPNTRDTRVRAYLHEP